MCIYIYIYDIHLYVCIYLYMYTDIFTQQTKVTFHHCWQQPLATHRSPDADSSTNSNDTNSNNNMIIIMSIDINDTFYMCFSYYE